MSHLQGEFLDPYEDSLNILILILKQILKIQTMIKMMKLIKNL